MLHSDGTRFPNVSNLNEGKNNASPAINQEHTGEEEGQERKLERLDRGTYSGNKQVP